MTSLIPVAANVDVNGVPQDNIYAGTSNTMIAEFQALGAQSNKISLASKRLPSNQQINLQHGGLLGFTMMALKFKASDIAVGLELSAGWGYRCLDYVEFSLGDSTTLRMTGDHILQKVLSDCENKDKRQQVLSLGGDRVVGSAGPPVFPTIDQVAYVAIPLPFSNTGASRSLMFDSSILHRPVTLRVQFKTPEQIFQRATGSAAFPTEFSDCYVVSKTAIMTNPTQSIRELVGMNGSASYSQPYMFPNSWNSSTAIGSSPKSGGQARQSVRMDGFQNGSCLSIDLWLRLESVVVDTVLKQVGQADFPYPDNAYLKMRDISVLYGGQTLWQSDDEVDALMSLSEYSAGTSFGTTIRQNTDAGVDHISRWYHVQLSLQQESYFTNLIQHGANLVNNTIEVRFHTPEISELKVPATTATPVLTSPTYRLYANVNYQASVRVAKGSAHLDFVPPVPLLQGTISGNVPF